MSQTPTRLILVPSVERPICTDGPTHDWDSPAQGVLRSMTEPGSGAEGSRLLRGVAST